MHIPKRHAVTLGPYGRGQPVHAVRGHRIGQDVDMQLPLLLGRGGAATVHVAGVDEVLGIIISSKGMRQRERRLPTF